MSQAHVIDLAEYREQHDPNKVTTETLVEAIQSLIQRLRDSNPIN